MSDNFSYTYSAPSKDARSEIENIRKQYSPDKSKKVTVDLDREDAWKRLLFLHRRAGKMPKIIAILVAVAGTLIFGLGMSLVLVWENFILGVPIGISGIAVLCLIVLIYRLLLKRSKRKFGAEIVALCDRLLNEENN